jgi:Ni,Fe-hydrogenase maturation factor
VTVIGLGSAFGDDRVGWRAAKLLSQRLAPALARVLPLDRPGPGLPEALAGRAEAGLVDTLRRGRALGLLPPRLAVYLVSIDPTDTAQPDARLTQEVEAAAVRLARELEQELTHR